MSLLANNGLSPQGEPSRQQSSRDDDAQLMARIRKGDELAFAALVRRHSDRFYRVAYRFSNNRSEAEDRVQEAFIRLWERPAMWQEDRNTAFTTWFHRVLVNLCLDQRKKKLPLPLAEDLPLPDTRDSQETVLMLRQKEQLVESQIAALPERQRTALNLCFYEELSNQEAAAVMGIHLKALQSLLMRAKTTLREKLKDHAGG